MNVIRALAGCALILTSCNLSPPYEIFGPVAADPIDCAAGSGLFQHDFAGMNGSAEGTVESSLFSPPDRVDIDFVDGTALRFTASGGLPPLLPANGPMTLWGGSSNCFGEGCDVTFYTLATPALGTFVELGVMNTIDDATRTWGPSQGGPLSMRLGTDDDVCPEGGGPVPSVLQIATDDGVVEVLPGHSADVRIASVVWRGAARASRREEFVQTDDECADCAGPGLHSITELAALLYRVDDSE